MLINKGGDGQRDNTMNQHPKCSTKKDEDSKQHGSHIVTWEKFI